MTKTAQHPSGTITTGPHSTSQHGTGPDDTGKASGHHHAKRSFSDFILWSIAVLACLWIALCTSVGPIYRADGSIADYSWGNALILIVSFAVCFTCIIVLYRWSQHAGQARMQADGSLTAPAGACSAVRKWLRRGDRPGGKLEGFRHMVIRCTDRWWKIAIILLVGWLWAYVSLLVAFGADIHSQINEFNLWWANLQGVSLPYKDGFTQMDVYPTAHYLWPDSPTYLTNQHNIVLTMLYGGVVAVFRALTGSDDAGLVALAGMQLVFAAFCCSVTADRFFTFGNPQRISARDDGSLQTGSRAGAFARLAVLACFLLSPLAVFSTISLTKSPLFAFAFVWWLGIWYQLLQGRRERDKGGTPASLVIAMTVATVIMLLSVKYALYIVAVQIVLALITDRRRWRVYVISLLIPLIAFEAMITVLVGTGTIINGDPIESKGIQLQQIARVAQRNPQGIPEEARKALDPIVDLDAMGREYFPNDADRVKSSGTAGKVTTYRWRTVTAEDMTRFNGAWLQIGLRNPVLYLDAFLAKTYGYFDVTDSPYVSMGYYVNNDYVQVSSTWIKNWAHGWRNTVAQSARNWGNTPVVGVVTRGNFWVVLTLLLLGAQLVLKRWRSLAYQFPLLLLMGVMIIAPANNFERHMLPVAFSFAFIALAFWHESRVQGNQVPEKPHGDKLMA
ncbi:MAG: DUF6020 family protein [Bifidobacterium psychraerophilum]|uniref:DUF6020 family protein n=1 Tax=Bifidobacterium psychraerophilum TaxID=218140 RepID=UPI0039ED1899